MRAGRLLQQALQARQQHRHIHRLRLQFLLPRKGHHALGQRGATLGAARGGLHQRAQPLVGRHALAQQLQAAEHGHQQVVEVMGHAAREAADGLHLQGLAQLGFGGLALGHIAGDLGKADQPALIVDGIDDHRGPKARAILAHAQAFGLHAARADRRAQPRLGQPGLLVFGRVKAREMGVEDLLLLIALDALGAQVPAHDAAFGVEHVDRIVGHALHQQGKAALCAGKRAGQGRGRGRRRERRRCRRVRIGLAHAQQQRRAAVRQPYARCARSHGPLAP